MRSRSSLAIALGAFLLAACGGGGTSGSPPAAPSPSPTKAPLGTSALAYATITVPAKHAAGQTMRRVRRDWVSPSSMSINIEVINSDGSSESTTQALTASTSGCTQLANDALSCMVPFEALTTASGQTDEIEAETSSSNPFDEGDALSYGQLTGETVNPGATNNFSLELGGVIGAIESSEDGAPVVYQEEPQSLDIPIEFMDAEENSIDGPFDVPATIALSGAAAGSFTFTQPAISGSSGTIADPTTLTGGDIILAYDGSGIYGTTAVLTVSSNSPQTLGNFGQQVICTITITISSD